MANRWNVPAWLEAKVRARDQVCVYCGTGFTRFKVSARSAPSWEHIINDATLIGEDNIALRCRGCNASKGQKRVSDWLVTPYCKDRGISAQTVAPIIQRAICNGQ
ncbi:hypothetical protein SAMN05877809_103206 [Rhodobacter sp. JA431]|nr:hypothetical protein SAMN05877809_103206 [Rhodobacter sp. JA431]